MTDAVTVPDYPSDKTAPKVTVDDPNQLPDGKTTGTTKVDVTVTYPDGSKDKLQVPVTIKDTIAPKIKDIDDKTVIEKQAIDEITVETDDPQAKVSVEGLPDGLNYNKETGKITGTPEVKDWGKDEEEKNHFTVHLSLIHI